MLCLFVNRTRQLRHAKSARRRLSSKSSSRLLPDLAQTETALEEDEVAVAVEAVEREHHEDADLLAEADEAVEQLLNPTVSTYPTTTPSLRWRKSQDLVWNDVRQSKTTMLSSKH